MKDDAQELEQFRNGARTRGFDVVAALNGTLCRTLVSESSIQHMHSASPVLQVEVGEGPEGCVLLGRGCAATRAGRARAMNA